jgi:hypothetical protein
MTDRAMFAIDMCRMLKRRLKDAGLPARLSPHSFRYYPTILPRSLLAGVGKNPQTASP